MDKIKKIYSVLYNAYGPQGWWPLLGLKGVNPTKTGSVQGYHPGDFSYPRNGAERFEICCGAVLTQNTSWPQVEKALKSLKSEGLLGVQEIISVDVEKLKPLIKPAGYFNQKSAYLKNFAEFFSGLDGRAPSRSELLAVKGVGNETADSIMLYAFRHAEFVVDAYTKRIFSRLGLIGEKDSYDSVKQKFESELGSDVNLFQEYHALIVEHAKRHCKAKPECDGCVIKGVCEYCDARAPKG